MTESPPIIVHTVTGTGLAAEIADVAAVTFPLACPPHAAPGDIAAHIASTLPAEAFAGWIASAQYDVIVAREGADGPVVGYALVDHGAPSHPDVLAALRGLGVASGPVSEVSKMYVLPGFHARGRDGAPSHLLMDAAIAAAVAHDSVLVWLGVNELNGRALKYYRKRGFRRIGTKTFDMNGVVEHDFVMARELP